MATRAWKIGLVMTMKTNPKTLSLSLSQTLLLEAVEKQQSRHRSQVQA